MTLSDLKGGTQRAHFPAYLNIYARTDWPRTTNFSMVADGEGHVCRGQPRPPSQLGGTRRFQILNTPLSMPMRFDLERPNSGRKLMYGRGMFLHGQIRLQSKHACSSTFPKIGPPTYVHTVQCMGIKLNEMNIFLLWSTTPLLWPIILWHQLR